MKSMALGNIELSSLPYLCTWPLRQCSCEHDLGIPECGPPVNLAWAGTGKGGH